MSKKHIAAVETAIAEIQKERIAAYTACRAAHDQYDKEYHENKPKVEALGGIMRSYIPWSSYLESMGWSPGKYALAHTVCVVDGDYAVKITSREIADHLGYVSQATVRNVLRILADDLVTYTQGSDPTKWYANLTKNKPVGEQK